MKNIRIAVLALGALVVLVALAGCGSSKTHGETGTLTLFEPGGNSGMTTPFGKFNGKSFTPGTGIVAANPLQNSNKRRPWANSTLSALIRSPLRADSV